MWGGKQSLHHKQQKRQADLEVEQRQIFLEKRQGTRKKRKRVGTENALIPAYPALGGITSNRLSRGLSNSLSTGVHGVVPTIKRVQDQINRDLERHKVDLSSLKGPPTYRSIPKPDLLMRPPPPCTKEIRAVVHKENQGRAVVHKENRPTGVPRSSAEKKISGRVKEDQAPNRRDRQGSRETKSRDNSSRDTTSRGVQEREMFEVANRLIAKAVTEAWPTLDYERKLQESLSQRMKEAQERLAARSEAECRSGGSSTNLNQPFTNWSINEEESDVDAPINDFNRSFCRTVKRTFYKDASFSEPAGPAKDPFQRPRMNLSSSGLSLLGMSGQSDSGCETMDFLDTIIDSSVNSTDNKPDLIVRGVKHDFLDEVDRMYNFYPRPLIPTSKHPRPTKSKGKRTRTRLPSKGWFK